MSLRSRLSIMIVAVVFGALAVADVAVYTFVSRYLEQRLDDQLASLTGPVFGLLRGGAVLPAQAGGRRGPFDLSGGYAELRDSTGAPIAKGYLLGQAGTRGAPDLRGAPEPGLGEPVFWDTAAPAKSGTIAYRARLQRLPTGSVIVTALPVTDLNATKHRLLLLQGFATAAIVLGSLALVWWIVGVGLRPLTRIEDTAERIAAGDLTERVEPSGERTEIARLGAALNAMLDAIEGAFAAQEASERRLRRFVSDASHDLRTPLTSIRGYAELLDGDRDIDDATRRTALLRIEQESERLSALVDDLLLLARLDEGALPVDQPVDLVELANDVVGDACMAAPDREIALSVSNDGVEMSGDRNQLMRALSNLVENARKHTPPATPIEVHVRQLGSEAIVEVVDHGPGISPADRPRVFDRFWRADPSRTRSSGGSGLGLAIVAAVTNAHAGECDVVETPGGGATFRLRFPASRAPAPMLLGSPELVTRP